MDQTSIYDAIIRLHTYNLGVEKKKAEDNKKWLALLLLLMQNSSDFSESLSRNAVNLKVRFIQSEFVRRFDEKFINADELFSVNYRLIVRVIGTLLARQSGVQTDKILGFVSAFSWLSKEVKNQASISEAAIVSAAKKEIILATGFDTDATVKATRDAISAKIGAQARKNWLVNDTLWANMPPIEAQLNAVSGTLVSHVVASISSLLFSRLFKSYIWQSILDNKTSEICRERHGHVYMYGSGPVPPAHYLCRSSIIPLTGSGTIPAHKSFADWLKFQSAAFVTDALNDRYTVKPINETELNSKAEFLL